MKLNEILNEHADIPFELQQIHQSLLKKFEQIVKDRKLDSETEADLRGLFAQADDDLGTGDLEFYKETIEEIQGILGV